VGANSTHAYGAHPPIVLAALVAIGLVAASIFLCYGFADWLAQILDEIGTAIVIRLSAFLLLRLGVQIVWNGINALLGSVHVQVQ